MPTRIINRNKIKRIMIIITVLSLLPIVYNIIEYLYHLGQHFGYILRNLSTFDFYCG